MEHWAARPFHRGGSNPLETADLDRWLFKTEPGLQAYSNHMKEFANHADSFFMCTTSHGRCAQKKILLLLMKENSADY